ncbi:hypothetical protein [Mesorhizobium sp. M0323]|uniref:hypothetical protein n=1 Tax=Mesorhizobium sp. M0323 TaxID=2956938 RepID=UPI00333DD0E1
MTKSAKIGTMFATALIAITTVSLAYSIRLKWEYEHRRAGVTDNSNSIDDEVADWTFGLLLTSIITVAITSGGLYWVARSLAATNRANDLSSRSLEISERAWIFTTPRAVGQKVTNRDGTWSLEVVFENINNGRTVALEVHTNADVAWYGVSAIFAAR